jgi:hypothetical protein
MALRAHGWTVGTIAAVSLAAGCGPIVGNTRLGYAEVCTAERPDCRADGDFAVTMPGYRPAFDGDPKTYLGSLVETSNVRRPRITCLPPISDDDYTKFENQLRVTLIKTSNIEARVKAVVEGSLRGLALNDPPAAKLAVSAAVSSKLKQKNYTAAYYNVYTLKDAFFEKLLQAPAGSPEASCREKLANNANRSFVQSIAVITAHTELNSDIKTDIASAVTASLQNFKVNNAAIDASMSGELALTISSSIERDIESETKQYKTVYSYGFWYPNPSAIRRSTGSLKSAETDLLVGGFNEVTSPQGRRGD